MFKFRRYLLYYALANNLKYGNFNLVINYKNNTDRRMGVILIRNYPDTANAMCQIYHAWHMAILITKHFHDFVQKILNTLQDC